LRENREGDGDGVKDGSDPRAEKNADGEQAEDDASDENNKAVVGVALGGGRHKVKKSRIRQTTMAAPSNGEAEGI
jgi:hypothetical protein